MFVNYEHSMLQNARVRRSVPIFLTNIHNIGMAVETVKFD